MTSYLVHWGNENHQQRTSITTPPTNWHLCPHTCFHPCRKGLSVLQSKDPHPQLVSWGQSPPVCQGHHFSTSPTFSPISPISPSFLGNPISTQTWCNLPHLKTKQQKLKTLHHPGSSASCFSTSFNSKGTLKNCLHLLSTIALLFLLTPFCDAESYGQFFIVCSIWQPITSSSLKHFLQLASRILQFSALLTDIFSVSHWFLLISSKLLCDKSLKLAEGFIYAHSLGNLISSLGFEYYDILTTPWSSPSVCGNLLIPELYIQLPHGHLQLDIYRVS